MGRSETELGKLMTQGSNRLCDYYDAPFRQSASPMPQTTVAIAT